MFKITIFFYSSIVLDPRDECLLFQLYQLSIHSKIESLACFCNGIIQTVSLSAHAAGTYIKYIVHLLDGKSGSMVTYELVDLLSLLEKMLIAATDRAVLAKHRILLQSVWHCLWFVQVQPIFT